MTSLTDPALLADPYRGYDRLREQAQAVRVRGVDGTPAWLVTRYADVRAVLSDPRFVNRPPDGEATANRDAMLESLGFPREFFPYLTQSVLDVDGVDHTRLRKLVSRAFTVRRVDDLRPRVQEIADALLDELGGTLDLLPAFGYPLPITVICELVGVPAADRSRWRRLSAASRSTEPGRMGSAITELVGYTHDLVDRRRRHPADDLVTELVRAQDEDGDRLSDVELVTMVLALVIAGHETTANLIGNGTLALLTHPDQVRLLRRDPGLWPSAVTELMRWCGPIQMARMRYASVDAEVGGQPVRTGEAVQVVLVSANRDPRVYADPERLDVTRQPPVRGDGHVGFGHGIHYCLGAALARQEGEVALRGLFERFPTWPSTTLPSTGRSRAGSRCRACGS